MTWNKRILADKRYVQFEERFLRSWMTKANVKELTEEVKMLHLNRTDTSFHLGMSKLVDKIIKATALNQANRSRLCAIKLQINETSVVLNEYHDKLVGYLMTRYVDDLHDAGFRSKDAKLQAIAAIGVFGQVSKYLTSLGIVWDNCDLVINDIDQSGFSINRIEKALEIHVTGREAGL